MKIGFARTSTTNQKFGLEHQIELLEMKVVRKSSKTIYALASKRPEFEKALDFAREGTLLLLPRCLVWTISKEHLGQRR